MAVQSDYGPYQILKRIAVGGMAEISLARQQGIEGLERQVIIKRVLPKYLGDEEFTTMFLDEARLMAALSHPHIAQVFDVGKSSDSYYLVMEYVRGPTLGDMLGAASHNKMRGLPLKESLGIILALAEALDYIHNRHDELGRRLNIVHRDLNPSNLIVSYDGIVKLIDFGIAKTASRVYETRTGVVKGTYGYISPEQFTHAAPIDHRADIFALGVILYETCLGCHPFDVDDERQLLERIVSANYRKPRDVVSKFPSQLEKIIVKCLAPHPEGRPENVRALIMSIVDFMVQARLIPTMGDLALLVSELVPDTEGPIPLQPKSFSSVLRAPRREATLTSMSLSGKPKVSGTTTELDERDIDAYTPMTRPGGHPRTIEINPSLDQDVVTYPASSVESLTSPEKQKQVRQARAALAQSSPDEPTQPNRVLQYSIIASLIVILGVAGHFLWKKSVQNAVLEQTSEGTLPHTADNTQNTPATDDTNTKDEATVLWIVSEPPGAHVRVNGKEISSRTPAAIRLTDTHESTWIHVSKPGFRSQEREVQPLAGEARFVLVALPKP